MSQLNKTFTNPDSSSGNLNLTATSIRFWSFGNERVGKFLFYLIFVRSLDIIQTAFPTI